MIEKDNELKVRNRDSAPIQKRDVVNKLDVVNKECNCTNPNCPKRKALVQQDVPVHQSWDSKKSKVTVEISKTFSVCGTPQYMSPEIIS